MERKSTGLRESMYSWVISEISDAERVGVPVRVDGVLYSTEGCQSAASGHGGSLLYEELCWR